MSKEIVVASEWGDRIIRRAGDVKCSPAPPLNAEPRAPQAFGRTEPGRRSHTQDLAVDKAGPAAPRISASLLGPYIKLQLLPPCHSRVSCPLFIRPTLSVDRNTFLWFPLNFCGTRGYVLNKVIM